MAPARGRELRESGSSIGYVKAIPAAAAIGSAAARRCERAIAEVPTGRTCGETGVTITINATSGDNC